MAAKVRGGGNLLLALGITSLLFFVLARAVAIRPPRVKDEMIRASRCMEKALEAIRRCREARGIPVDSASDVNLTGIIGLEASPITTSLGNLEAKRSTANPNFSALLVLLLDQAGVKKGDAVAVGASGSFPALIVAALCALRTLELKPLVICSLGASQWGANDPRFDWLKMMDCLRDSGIAPARPIALSLGGEGDVGEDMSPEGRELLLRAGQETGLRFISEPVLEKNVLERTRLFDEAAGGKKIAAFINIGGGYADMGTDSEILKVDPGLADFRKFPPPERRGLIFAMAARGIPVIHLLYVKGLCDRYGLPWDPKSMPRPGEGVLFQRKEPSARGFVFVAVAYFLTVLLLAIFWRR
jgi:poly-gamma-glutamate system protein